ncbi:YifB family Mg chelatase-like AAA ATPase [Candidatus Falkowbacteria bacterium]|jgi:magnesium chelatase family protein|nr:YifB family Mg chelatase-like AAA ATPase [Candidatus Falkowbacteria bacterium]MBT4432774.1 YifB family Mg chelatase-like AAA ATPase [Candidatus Falkowbacteria bacterium]
MSSKIFSATSIGLHSEPVEVEADISGGLGNFVVVGLPDTAVQESRERVRSAIKNSSLTFPQTRITINLAPADIKKEGPIFDLPIALSVLIAGSKNFISKIDLKKSIFIGELSLDGTLRGVNGVLPIAIMAKEKGFKTLFLPKANTEEASLIEGLEIIPLENLNELIKHITGVETISPSTKKYNLKDKQESYAYDMSQVRGQEMAKRAMEIAAAGGHNILMSGPPGTGKTLLARTLPSILPKMTLDEVLEATKIYSVSGKLNKNQSLINTRPFRNPHHTSSAVALIGGGTWPKPGEISLAHRGVLFLDEFPEFSRHLLESLRQPLEDGVVTVSRATGSLDFPAKFILIAAQNPCPCGNYSDPDKDCTCSPNQVIKYNRKISGPLLDRIDLNIEVEKVKIDKLTSAPDGEKSETIRERVQNARDSQNERFKNLDTLTNSEMKSEEVEKFCEIDKESEELLKNAIQKFNLSARSYFRILKLSRTIADLAREENIKLPHLAEALQYRPKSE